ncbi:MAG TPA: Mur ligase family protein [Candidatus Paceibacterota bacterium]|nr:Mur ligase family protein [Candidatus Paceibacterota bacterium]
MDGNKAHFIGIGGVGMAATAKLLKDAGWEVTGSDEEVYPPISDFLATEGFIYQTPYKAENIPPDADLIVIGKNAKLIPETNAEVKAAYQSGKRIRSFPEVLGELSAQQQAVVVAGSYGKSTSTALMAHVLQESGLDPSYFIGAIPYTPAANAHMGKGGVFVLEGDEYPASNTDPRSKFLLMRPAHVLITPLAHDHFNIFPTPEDYLKPFSELAALVPQDGALVISTAGSLSKQFIASLARAAITYGVHEGDFHAADIAWGETTAFSLMRGSEKIAELTTNLLGEHNIENIVGVGAFLFTRALVTPEQLRNAVASFRGIRRRLDKKSDRTSIPVYEGFGSSYDKLKSAIAAMKLHFPDRRLVVVFEPNTIAWRSRAALAQYDDAFRGAGKAIIFNPPHDGKATELSLEDIVAHVQSAGTETVGVDSAEMALSAVANGLNDDDAVLISSSGAMGGLPESIPALLEKKFPA